jgi:hypothetical protein
MRTIRCVLGIGTAAIALAACGSSGPSSSSLSPSAARTEYSAALEPVTAALNAFDNKANIWTSSTTDAQAATDAHSAIAALQTFKATLASGKWPSGATSDVQTLIGDLGTLTSQFQGLASLPAGQASKWFGTTFAQSSANVAIANLQVHHDLGFSTSLP